MYRLPGFGTLSGRSTKAFNTLNTMALAPMASARVSTAVRANPGALPNCRKASRSVALMRPPFELWDVLCRRTQAYPSITYGWELQFPFEIARFPAGTDRPTQLYLTFSRDWVSTPSSCQSIEKQYIYSSGEFILERAILSLNPTSDWVSPLPLCAPPSCHR